jgi:hypothetical protein
MINDSTHFERAVALFAAAHREDPETVISQGSEITRAYLYHQRLSHWVEHLDPNASEPSRLAAHCQHLRRWIIPRADYPQGLTGYRRWRRALTDFHVQEAKTILRQAGYDNATMGRVRDLLTKQDLKRDAEVQRFEDAVCLVFFEIELLEFAGKHDRNQVIRILTKVWMKMSENGREIARQLVQQQPGELQDLFDEAVIKTE